jgi:HAE1 family hydrophobic/amphiphilic exporter-1
MTVCSTVLGFLPMALSFGQASDLWAPLAITVIGGLLGSTLLTLFVLPCLISMTEMLRLRGLRVSGEKSRGFFQKIFQK